MHLHIGFSIFKKYICILIYKMTRVQPLIFILLLCLYSLNTIGQNDERNKILIINILYVLMFLNM